MDEVKKFFCQFPNPWALRVSRDGLLCLKMHPSCQRRVYEWLYTVGAQSLAPAQSIAHGQIGDSISKKNKIFEKLFFTKDKKW